MQHEANTNFAWDPSTDSQKLLLYSVVYGSHKEGVILNESVVNRGRSMQPFKSPAAKLPESPESQAPTGVLEMARLWIVFLIQALSGVWDATQDRGYYGPELQLGHVDVSAQRLMMRP